MSLVNRIGNAVRMAGSALNQYASDPNTYKGLANKVALDTALGTATAQVVPRVLGVPAPSLGQTALNTAVHSAISNPTAGALSALGVPQWAAQTTGQVLGGAGAQIVNGAMTQPIRPEANTVMTPEMARYMAVERFNAELEQQRYNNQINLALARNYSQPTEIIHKNPSAELETVANLLNQKVQY